MPSSSETKMRNTRNVKKELLLQRADRAAADILDSKLSGLEQSRRRDIIPAAGEMTSVMRQRNLLKEISVCRAENTQLRNLLEKRSRMLSTAISAMEQNGIRIPAGAKKFNKTKKKKSMKKPKSRGKTRRNMSKRRRR